MQKFSKYLSAALFLAFFLFGLSAFIQSKPHSKNTRVYTFVKTYSPYQLEKRFGGLEIIKKGDSDFKKKPDNMTLFKEFERLEKAWGQKHLSIRNYTLRVMDDNGTLKAELPLKTKEELHFIQDYYGINP